MHETATIDERPVWGRGALAKNDAVTPRASDDAAKFKLSLRDVLILLAGALAMYGAQLGVQWRTQAAIDNLAVKMDGYQQKQEKENVEMQRQLDEVRRTANMGVAVGNDAAKEAARLEGILMGAGIKGVPKS